MTLKLQLVNYSLIAKSMNYVIFNIYLPPQPAVQLGTRIAFFNVLAVLKPNLKGLIFCSNRF